MRSACSALHRAAFHESGHCVVAYAVGAPCREVSITLDGAGTSISADAVGIHKARFRHRCYRSLSDALDAQLLVNWGGVLAECIKFGICDAAHAAGDLCQIAALRGRYHLSDARVDRLRRAVRPLLIQHWDAIEAVAAGLLRYRHLSAAAIDALVVISD